jgi:autophagy-related protein 13
MTILLKSLITVTRVLPAYKISRMKGDYSIEYCVYSGSSPYNNLGKECRVNSLGSVSTPYGSIIVEYGYRTKMEISFEQCPVVCKEDHFNVLDSTHQPNFEPTTTQIPRSPNTVNAAKIPAFSEPFPNVETEFDEDEIPFSSLLKKSTAVSNQPEPESDDTKMSPPVIQHEIDSSSGGDDSANPAFEFIEIKQPPFAPDLPDSDPATFFATLQNAPQLTSLPDIEIRELDQQMQIFEENVDFFDDFVQKLCINE